MTINDARTDSALKQKKGLHFILASVIIWTLITILHATDLPVLTKNLYTFIFTAPLMPLAYVISKGIHVDFQNKDNPLTNLGILFSLNQMIYLIIAMWIYPTIPEKMLMVVAIIFGAHLLPYGWLYRSRAYTVLAVFIPVLALILGLSFDPVVLGLAMIMVELLFSALLVFEVKKLRGKVA